MPNHHWINTPKRKGRRVNEFTHADVDSLMQKLPSRLQAQVYELLWATPVASRNMVKREMISRFLTTGKIRSEPDEPHD